MAVTHLASGQPLAEQGHHNGWRSGLPESLGQLGEGNAKKDNQILSRKRRHNLVQKT